MSLFIANNKMMSINGIPLMLPDVEAFAFKIDTTKGNGLPSFKIPTLAGTVNNFSYRVDYTGAWTPITAWDQPETLITFPNAGIYTIEIRGTTGAWYDNNTGDVQKYVELISFGDTIFNSISGMFYGAVNLKFAGSSTNKLVKKGPNAPNITTINDFCRASGVNYIPEEIFHRVPKTLSFYSNFRDCTQALGSIPVDYMRYMHNLLATQHVLTNCSGLTGGIPTDMLRYVPKLQSIFNFLYGCSGLTGSIQSDLLRYVPDITNITGLFSLCSGLTGTIPTDILRYVPKVTTLAGFLYGCSNLTGHIPTDILRYVPLVANLENFLRGCSKLTGNIPTEILMYVPKVILLTNFMSATVSLSGVIPTDMLMYVPLVTNVQSLLYGCSGLTGIAPSLKNCKNVTAVNYFMYGMRNLTIPTDMFDLPSINKITAWSGCLQVTDTNYSHTGTLQPIWDYELETATGKSIAFLNCTAITNYTILRTNWP